MNISVIPNYLDPGGRAWILAQLAVAPWQPSMVHEPGKVDYVSTVRTSENLFEPNFPDPLRAFLNQINYDIKRRIGRFTGQFEGWQALRYRPGQEFKPHTDPLQDSPNRRDLTVIITLQAPQGGGYTAFPNLGTSVASVPGTLLIWENLLPGGAVDPDSLHTGTAVTAGEKIILVNWILQK